MSSVDPTLGELGYPKPDPPPQTEGQPPGGSKWLVPHFQQAVSFLNPVSRTYHWTHDEALRESALHAEAMWADTVINTAINDRIQPVVQLESQLEPRDPSDQAQKDHADLLTECLEDIPDFQGLKVHLMRACWWGRSAVQTVLKWDFAKGKRLLVDSWDPIHGDSLVFKFDGSVGILVNSLMLGQPNVERIEHRGGAALFPPPDKRQRLLVHEFERMPAAFYRPEMQGSVHGSGLRGQVYWFWWQRHNLSKFMFDFVRKAANGFMVAGYAAGNRAELEAMKQALEEQAGHSTLYVPVDQNRPVADVLHHIPTSMTGAEMQLRVIAYLDDIIRGRILGETNANSPAPTGLGGSQAEQRGMTDDERVKYDAKGLEAPLQDLVNTLSRNINPAVRPPKFRFLCDKRAPEELIEAANWFMQAGGVIPKSWAQQQLGIPDPQPGDETLSLIQAMQPTALGAVPAGVPMAGVPGPAPGVGGQPADGQGAPQSDEDTVLESQIQPEGGAARMARADAPVIVFEREKTLPPDERFGQLADGLGQVREAVGRVADLVAARSNEPPPAAPEPDPRIDRVLGALADVRAEVARPRSGRQRVIRGEDGLITETVTEYE